MKKELDEQLCREFPHLYSDRNKSMRETCMYWGFDVADGWFKIIYDLSLKLEIMIVKFITENKQELRCKYCSRKENEHTQYYTFTEDGNTSIAIQDVVEYTSKNPIDPKNLFECKEFEASYPRASQVKEKFGGLRFYMSSSTDEMEAAISEAEGLCSDFCEDCGSPGETCTDHGWYRTLCPACVDKYNKGTNDGFGFRVRSYIQCSKLKELDENGKDEEESSSKEEGGSGDEKEENGNKEG